MCLGSLETVVLTNIHPYSAVHNFASEQFASNCRKTVLPYSPGTESGCNRFPMPTPGGHSHYFRLFRTTKDTHRGQNLRDAGVWFPAFLNRRNKPSSCNSMPSIDTSILETSTGLSLPSVGSLGGIGNINHHLGRAETYQRSGGRSITRSAVRKQLERSALPVPVPRMLTRMGIHVVGLGE